VGGQPNIQNTLQTAMLAEILLILQFFSRYVKEPLITNGGFIESSMISDGMLRGDYFFNVGHDGDFILRLSLRCYTRAPRKAR
jgi:hypothetical protein